jgi:hypothetical protein
VPRPTLGEAEVADVERQRKISLPADYREFLTPLGTAEQSFMTSFPLETWMTVTELSFIREFYRLIGDLG